MELINLQILQLKIEVLKEKGIKRLNSKAVN